MDGVIGRRTCCNLVVTQQECPLSCGGGHLSLFLETLPGRALMQSSGRGLVSAKAMPRLLALRARSSGSQFLLGKQLRGMQLRGIAA